jgi:hypothetical protein
MKDNYFKQQLKQKNNYLNELDKRKMLNYFVVSGCYMFYFSFGLVNLSLLVEMIFSKLKN